MTRNRTGPPDCTASAPCFFISLFVFRPQLGELGKTGSLQHLKRGIVDIESLPIRARILALPKGEPVNALLPLGPSPGSEMGYSDSFAGCRVLHPCVLCKGGTRCCPGSPGKRDVSQRGSIYPWRGGPHLHFAKYPSNGLGAPISRVSCEKACPERSRRVGLLAYSSRQAITVPMFIRHRQGLPFVRKVSSCPGA